MTRVTQRFPLLDCLRIIAMLDIVSIHLTHRYLIAGAGLPIFIVTAIALAVRKPELPPLGEAAIRRTHRILLPWLVWSIFFGLNRLFWASFNPDHSLAWYFYPWMLAAGTAVHLWFLPFIFAAEIAVVAILRPLQRLHSGWVIAGAIAAGFFCIWLTGLIYDRHDEMTAAITADQMTYRDHAELFSWTVRKSWLFASASVCLGVALGRTLSLSGSPAARRIILAAATVIFAASFVWEYWPTGPIHGHAVWQWWRQAAAFFAVAIAIQYTGKTPAWITRVAVLTMGIYLLHSWCDARVYGSILPRLWRMEWPVDLGPTMRSIAYSQVGRLTLIWLVTALLVTLLRRTPARLIL